MSDITTNWNGLSLSELRMRRAKAMIVGEVSKERMLATANVLQQRAKAHGVRGLIFNNSMLKGLKLTDYLLLGGKATLMIYKLWSRRRK